MSLINDLAGAICCVIGFALIFNARKIAAIFFRLFRVPARDSTLAGWTIFWRSLGLLWALAGIQFILGVLQLPKRH